MAPYGAIGRVHNIWASRTARLRSRGSAGSVTVTEVHGKEALRVLQRHWRKVGVVRPTFDVTDGDDLAAFKAELPQHPVSHING